VVGVNGQFLHSKERGSTEVSEKPGRHRFPREEETQIEKIKKNVGNAGGERAYPVPSSGRKIAWFGRDILIGC